MKENQAAYAKYKRVSRKTVTRWKQRGLMLFKQDGSVNFEATDRLLRGNFGSMAGDKTMSGDAPEANLTNPLHLRRTEPEEQP